MTVTVLPPPQDVLRRHVLLLDVDGTLLDIAPTPESVVVPEGLPETLDVLHRALAGGLAIISGRPLDQIDLLTRNTLPAGAEHGAVLRIPPDPVRRLQLPSVPQAWRQVAAGMAARFPGARIEDKESGFVLHYRNAPAAGPALDRLLRGLMQGEARFEILPADMAWEVRPRGADKGTALQAIMQGRAFVDRIPLFIGDDITDLDAIRAAQTMGGIGLRVAESFGSPASVRSWLSDLRRHAETRARGGA